MRVWYEYFLEYSLFFFLIEGSSFLIFIVLFSDDRAWGG